MSMPIPAPEGPLSTIDLVALSDLAWTMLDPDGEHEALEQAWTAALPNDWPPAIDNEELQARLKEAATRLRPAGDDALLELVATVIGYLAAHPDRRHVDQAVVAEAVHGQYGAGPPDDIARWLARRTPPRAHNRRHGAPKPRRHLHSRPPAPGDRD
jgi:hypothetical protein